MNHNWWYVTQGALFVAVPLALGMLIGWAVRRWRAARALRPGKIAGGATVRAMVPGNLPVYAVNVLPHPLMPGLESSTALAKRMPDNALVFNVIDGKLYRYVGYELLGDPGDMVHGTDLSYPDLAKQNLERKAIGVNDETNQ